MAILKSEIINKFTTIPNSVIRAKDISDGDYRLLIYLYSLPNGWKINQGYLGTELNCSRININKKIKRIKEAGYLEIIKSSSDKSTDYIYVLKEKDVSPRDVSVSDVSSRDVSVSDTHINTNKINTDITNNELNNSSNSNTQAFSNLFEFIEKVFNRTFSEFEYEKISSWKDNELTRYAIQQTMLQGKTNLSYIEGILRNYKEANITTIEQAKIQEENFKNRKNKSNKNGKQEIIYDEL